MTAAPVSLFLLAIAGILLAGNFGEILFRRTGVPDALWLVGTGLVLGPGLHLLSADQLVPLTPYFGTLALIVVLLEGGSRLRLPELVRAPRAAALAALGFLLSVTAAAAGSMLAASLEWLPAGWGWPQALVLGAILGGSSAAILLPALTHARIDPRVAGMLSLEAALADALAVLTVAALVDGATLAASGVPNPGHALAAHLAIGLGLGVLAGLLGLLFLRALRGVSHAYPITLSILLVLFVLIGRAGGDPVAGILAVAVVLGNAPAISRALKFESGVELEENVRGFHSQLAFVIKALFFTFVGVAAGGAWPQVLLGILLAVAVAAVRWPAIVVATRGSGLTVAQKHVIWAGAPRGMATGVLALLPAGAGLWAAGVIQATAFSAIIASVVIFTVALRAARMPAHAAPAARTWTPAAAAVLPQPSAGIPVWSPRPAAPPSPVPDAVPVDPFKGLDDLFPPIAPAARRPDTAREDITSPNRDADIKPGSGFRW